MYQCPREIPNTLPYVVRLTRVGDWEVSTCESARYGLETCVFNDTTTHNGDSLGFPVTSHGDYTEAMIFHMDLVLQLTEHPVSLHKFGHWSNPYA